MAADWPISFADVPTYVYRFVETGETIEVQQSFTEATLTETEHPVTGETMPVKKVFQPVGVTFRGDGFYKTDNRASSKKSSGGDSTSSGTDTSSSNKDSSGVERGQGFGFEQGLELGVERQQGVEQHQRCQLRVNQQLVQLSSAHDPRRRLARHLAIAGYAPHVKDFLQIFREHTARSVICDGT